jgi:hypothetical protein
MLATRVGISIQSASRRNGVPAVGYSHRDRRPLVERGMQARQDEDYGGRT